ncbi:uncharacterized protein LOC108676787 [Hyalella azteca]|uniref:Uncharacterized protein LOC108676787 n=1 Tax=Hyalella azteca TaxID=294128 RepID=A0A8B7P2S6_HYAAZ|nr:uncharacterized protein LOC108676787 [Hyalella azteca]XP_018020415.1 uncharacterized protein LOC108676787 [Hyalella azteca]XP_047739710.1 uncharacterized protein LOC108676787 [Hyalella azteca]
MMNERELMLSFGENTTTRTGEGAWGIERLLSIVRLGGGSSGSWFPGANWSNAIRFVPRADSSPDTVYYKTLEQLCDDMERCSRVDGDLVEEVSYYVTRLASNQESLAFMFGMSAVATDRLFSWNQFHESFRRNFVLFPESFKHNFVLLKIGRGYWSVDKFRDGIVIQRSLSESQLKNKCLNNPRIIEDSGCRLECSRRNKFHSTSSRPIKTMKDFIGWMKESEHLSRPYNVMFSNCVDLTKELEKKFHQ